ncbi:hypothetical protein L1987_60097 [Smallanthus sonchifolius]|uniref:Uncharacterized protein n=1 Tax=Smallanthus sonchifolius TaxID=185202 RepID=A0ACB9D7H0_9ASTR|nr:hypothetical protein L1987_60097 [Smallanthus sonchifolius]
MFMILHVKTPRKTEHFQCDVCNFKACLEEADRVEYDEDIPKKKKGSQKSLKRRYEAGDPKHLARKNGLRIEDEPADILNKEDALTDKDPQVTEWENAILFYLNNIFPLRDIFECYVPTKVCPVLVSISVWLIFYKSALFLSGDVLLIDIDANAIPTCTYFPKQLSREELLKHLPEKWITNFKQIHQAPVQTTTAPDFVRHQDGLVEVKFKKQDRRDVFSTMFMIQPVKTSSKIEHFQYDVCNFKAWLEEADRVDYDEDIPKKKK